MSVFSNPVAGSTERAVAYTTAVLDLLGTRDPFEVLRDTPARLEVAVDGLSAHQVTQPEAVGKWSIRHVLQHLADSELVWGYRLRMVLTHDRPRLGGYDQDLWADRLRYDRVEAGQAIRDFTVLRDANLRLLTALPEADVKRVALHEERGEESVEHMIRLYAGHDLVHLRQIDRIRRTIGAAV